MFRILAVCLGLAVTYGGPSCISASENITYKQQLRGYTLIDSVLYDHQRAFVTNGNVLVSSYLDTESNTKYFEVYRIEPFLLLWKHRVPDGAKIFISAGLHSAVLRRPTDECTYMNSIYDYDSGMIREFNGVGAPLQVSTNSDFYFTLYMWDCATPLIALDREFREIFRAPVGFPVGSVQQVGDSVLVYKADQGQTAYAYNVFTGKEVAVLKDSDTTYGSAPSIDAPLGSRYSVITYGVRGDMYDRAWNLVRSWALPRRSYYAALSLDGKYCAVFSPEPNARKFLVFETESGEIVLEHPMSRSIGRPYWGEMFYWYDNTLCWIGCNLADTSVSPPKKCDNCLDWRTMLYAIGHESTVPVPPVEIEGRLQIVEVADRRIVLFNDADKLGFGHSRIEVWRKSED